MFGWCVSDQGTVARVGRSEVQCQHPTVVMNRHETEATPIPFAMNHPLLRAGKFTLFDVRLACIS